MIVSAWNNGSHHASGAGYGIKIKVNDRDRYFIREWGHVEIELGSTDQVARANIDKESFWNEDCRELINKDIGAWIRRQGLVPWSPYNPPKLALLPLGGNRFQLDLRVT